MIVLGTMQQAEHGQDEGAAAEEHGPARRRAGPRDGVEAAPRRARAPRVPGRRRTGSSRSPGRAPSPVSMLMTNTESVNPWATAPVRPRATTIETMARSSGSPAATRAPKTSTRMISAAGRPILSSPDLRSLWESSLRSRATRPLAGHRHAEAVSPVGGLDRFCQVLHPALGLVAQLDGDQQGVAVRGHEARVGPLVVDRGARDVAGGPGDRRKAGDLGPEGGLVDRESRRADHHHLARRPPVGEPLVDQVLGPDRVGVVGDLPLGGQVAEARRGARDAEDDGHEPDRDRAPGMGRAGLREPLCHGAPRSRSTRCHASAVRSWPTS